MTIQNVEEYALRNGLFKVGARPGIVSYLKEAIHRLDFAYTMSSYSNEAANAKSRLGSWWNVLLPTIQAATYGLVFGLILGANKPENFLAYLFTGVFLFSYMQGSFTNGSSAIISNAGLVRSLSFPRVLLPLSVVISQTITLLPQLAVLAVILIGTGQSITWSWLMLIPITALMFVFNFGLATIMARVTVHIRDLNKIVPFITRLLFYVSGVFFSVDKIFVNNPDSIYAFLIKLNPIYNFLNLARSCVLNNFTATAGEWITVIIWSFGLAAFGLFFFWGAEERYGRDL